MARNLAASKANLDDSFVEAPIYSLSHPLHPLTGVEDQATRTHINVLTYNIFLRPPLIKNNKSDHKDARLKEFIKLLPEFDIICFQEMFGLLNKRKHKLVRCATKAGFLYYADSTSPSFLSSCVVDGGLLVLSRFPIVAHEFQPFPYGVFSDALALKGVLYTKIQIKDQTLHLYNSHTQASYIGTSQKYSVVTRGDQFATFREFVVSSLRRHNYQSGEVVLAAGDMNVDANNPYIDTEQVQEYPGFGEYPHLAEEKQFNEYEAMKCYLSDNYTDQIEDLLYDSYGHHPTTYGESVIAEGQEERALETVLTAVEDLKSNQSLDFIFRLHPTSISKNSTEGQMMQKKGKLHIPPGSAKVEKFFIDGHTFTQLSDHYGAMVTLEYTHDESDSSISTHQPDQSFNKILIL